jgi:hypothetical protein
VWFIPLTPEASEKENQPAETKSSFKSKLWTWLLPGIWVACTMGLDQSSTSILIKTQAQTESSHLYL